MPTKYFTKSAFATALECPRRLYYAYDKNEYANQDLQDEFLQSLAEGGFQVGALAKVLYGIDKDTDIDVIGYDEALEWTERLFERENVNIAEAAFRSGNLFVRADIIEKKGNVINLIEVKAKSWDPREDSFLSKDGKGTSNKIRSYLYDVAFQKYVIEKALKEKYPNEMFTVKAHLMLADKSRTSSVDKLNQMFKIVKNDRGRSKVETAPIAASAVSAVKPGTMVIRAFDVDKECDMIISGEVSEQGGPDYMEGMKFEEFVDKMAHLYCNRIKANVTLGSKCFKCPFYSTDSDLKDGYKECWMEEAGFREEDFLKPLVKNLSGLYIGSAREKLIKDGRYFMEDITTDYLPKNTGKPQTGLDHLERKWLQIGIATSNEEILDYFRAGLDGEVYLDKDGIREEMEKWTYPLHFIDFETCAVALPFYKGMRPYEQIAFQFSHHMVEETNDGSFKITHAGDYINTEKGKFPSFEFIRQLKNNLDKDNGTIFRYSNHENNILREIYRQLSESAESDRKELMDFIDSITHWKDGKAELAGPRDMVDLADIVLKYYFHPEMGGSYSIKYVLPAVLNSSEYIQKKYSRPIYGTPQMPSRNLSEPKVWINRDPENGRIQNPYKLLPSVASHVKDVDTAASAQEDIGIKTIANGGAALAAYSKIQFTDETMTEALRDALLTYCELDTLAMVFIWEYFFNECNK